MPNPADSFAQPTNNYYQSVNKRSQTRLDATIEKINSARLFDAIITALDPDYANAYTVDVYEGGLGNPPTRLALNAVATRSEEYYAQWSPCRVMLDGDRAWIIGGTHIFGLYVTDPPNTSFKNRVQGYPADFLGSHDAGIANKIYINFQYPDITGAAGPSTYAVGDKFIWIKYPSPLQPGTDPATLGFVIQSSSPIPAPTQKYQVYTPIDDTLVPIWTTARFSA
jgi:hypothetical protein